MLSGSITLFKYVHSSKALSPINSTVFGILIVNKYATPLNASLPMNLVPGLIVTEDVHLLAHFTK
jgi:hypothetical protein